MFKIIGGAVVCGFGLYGLLKYLERPVVKVVINPAALREPGRAAGEEAMTDTASSPAGEPASSQAPDVEAAAATA